METDQEELLRHTYALAKENNTLLKKIRRGSFISFIFKILFWAAMLGLPLWIYFTFFKPVVDQGLQTYMQVQQMVGQGQETSTKVGEQMLEMKGLLDAIPGINLFTGGSL
jgi:hypothetical protein